MTLSDMIADLPTACDVGTKQNSQGYKESWIGYKRHLDVADGSIPTSGVLTLASTHDSQAAIPLAYITHERAVNLYDLMDSANNSVTQIPLFPLYACQELLSSNAFSTQQTLPYTKDLNF